MEPEKEEPKEAQQHYTLFLETGIFTSHTPEEPVITEENGDLQ